MASLEKTERIGGVGLLGVPTFDFCVWALDTYGRGELLMELHGHLPKFLVNPAFAFLCMWAGLGLLYLSHQRQLQRVLSDPSQLVGVDKYRKKEKPGWLLPLVLVFSVALVTAPILAIAYSLVYKGAPPLGAHLFPPSICKTAECFPPKPIRVIPRPTVINQTSNSPESPNIGINKGTINIGSSPQLPLQIKWSVRAVDSNIREFPYKQEVTLRVNTTYAPVSVAIICDSEISKVWAVGMQINSQSGIYEKHVGFIKYASPALLPGETLAIEILAKQPFVVKDVQRVTIN